MPLFATVITVTDVGTCWQTCKSITQQLI